MMWQQNMLMNRSQDKNTNCGLAEKQHDLKFYKSNGNLTNPRKLYKLVNISGPEIAEHLINNPVCAMSFTRGFFIIISRVHTNYLLKILDIIHQVSTAFPLKTKGMAAGPLYNQSMIIIFFSLLIAWLFLIYCFFKCYAHN